MIEMSKDKHALLSYVKSPLFLSDFNQKAYASTYESTKRNFFKILYGLHSYHTQAGRLTGLPRLISTFCILSLRVREKVNTNEVCHN